jgi:MFS family permease
VKLRDEIDPAQVERALRLSIADGMCWALMFGLGETYFVADAIRLGASSLELGLVATLPLCVGAAGPILALALLARFGRRRPLVVCAASLQALALATLALCDLARATTPALLMALAALYQVAGQGAGTPWSSWYGDLVPSGMRGRYFGFRNIGVYLFTCVGILLGGSLLEGIEGVRPGEASGAGGYGFFVVFGLAALARAACTALLARSPEPRFQGLSASGRVLAFARTGRGGRLVRLLLLGAAMQLAVYVAGPYFAPFMLEDLGFDYARFTAASLAIVLSKAAFAPLWGTWIDRHGARWSFGRAALLLALVPMPWLWAGDLAWVLVAQMISGFAWAGYEVALFALLVESSPRRVRPQAFAAQSVMNGGAQITGGLLGAALAGAVHDELRWVFAASFAGRLLAALVLTRLAPRGPRRGGDPDAGND